MDTIIKYYILYDIIQYINTMELFFEIGGYTITDAIDYYNIIRIKDYGQMYRRYIYFTEDFILIS